MINRFYAGLSIKINIINIIKIKNGLFVECSLDEVLDNHFSFSTHFEDDFFFVLFLPFSDS